MGLSVYTVEAVNKHKLVQMHTKEFSPPKKNFYGRTSVIAHYDFFEEMSYKVFLSELKVSNIPVCKIKEIKTFSLANLSETRGSFIFYLRL